MLLGVINRDKEVSGLTIHVIVKLKSVEKGRWRSWTRRACWSTAIGQNEILREEKNHLTRELRHSRTPAKVAGGAKPRNTSKYKNNFQRIWSSPFLTFLLAEIRGFHCPEEHKNLSSPFWLLSFFSKAMNFFRLKHSVIMLPIVSILLRVPWTARRSN